MKKKRQRTTAFCPSAKADAIKAMRRGSRELEKEIFGPGFHSMNRTFKSKKTYTRKSKHKNQGE